MKTDPLFAITALTIPQATNGAWFDGAPGIVLGFFFAMWVLGWLWVQVFRPMYMRRNGNSQDERRTNSADLMKCVEEIHEVVTLAIDPINKPDGRKAVYGLDPELGARLVAALEVIPLVVTELEATRGALGQINNRLTGIEAGLSRLAS